MLNRKDISRMLGDLFRTELARRQTDALAVFDEDTEGLWEKLPQEVKQTAEEKAAVMFNYMPRTFSALERMIDYTYASYLKNQQVVFLTSGSTGTPKRCIHTSGMIWEETRGVAPLFPQITRIVSLVPASHLYGFTFTVVLPHTLQVPVVTLPAIPTQSWDELLYPGDLMVAFPLFWNYWLRCENRFPEGVQVLSSTAPCKDEIINGLLQAGAQRFTEIYGSSETGAIGVRHQAGASFEILPFWEVSLKEDEPRIKRKSTTEWISLPDKVAMEQERFLRPISRVDACVQVAGINVFPKRVETVLGSHPAVKACKVRLMRPEEGERLKAFVVLNEGYRPDHVGIIRTFLAQRLTVHEIPRTFTFGPELPVSTLGKDADW